MHVYGLIHHPLYNQYAVHNCICKGILLREYRGQGVLIELATNQYIVSKVYTEARLRNKVGLIIPTSELNLEPFGNN